MKKLKSSCPVERSLEIINGKWKICILWKLSEKKYRFGELKKSMPDITIKMLSQQLKELEIGNFIHRKDFKTIPPKVEYSITNFGKSLGPIISQISNWGIKNKKHIDLTINRLRKN
jgi:DNA-binding HxlR family transcriptional regulator